MFLLYSSSVQIYDVLQKFHLRYLHFTRPCINKFLPATRNVVNRKKITVNSYEKNCFKPMKIISCLPCFLSLDLEFDVDNVEIWNTTFNLTNFINYFFSHILQTCHKLTVFKFKKKIISFQKYCISVSCGKFMVELWAYTNIFHIN